MDRPRPWLKYVSAADLESAGAGPRLDRVHVDSPSGDRLGAVDGFIVDSDSGRPYYVVVDAGGWFRSKHYLMPVGHVALDADRSRMVADLDRERVARFPGFNLNEFDTLSDDDLSQIDLETASVCCPADAAAEKPNVTPAERWAHHQIPEWWRDDAYWGATRTKSGGASPRDQAADRKA